MKQHELTDEQIADGRNNCVPFGILCVQQRQVLKSVGKNNLCQWCYIEEGWIPANLNDIYPQNTVYRIKPDYQRPEPPEGEEGEEWIVCDVFTSASMTYHFSHPLRDGSNMLSEAVNIVGFGGVWMKEHNCWEMKISSYQGGMTTALANELVLPATPLKVRFINPEFKG